MADGSLNYTPGSQPLPDQSYGQDDGTVMPPRGALGAANGYDGDGTAPQQNVDPGLAYSAMGYDPVLGALAMSAGRDPSTDPTQPTPYEQQMFGISSELAGKPGTKTGPLAQLQALKEQRDEAAASKMASINQAMSILQAGTNRTVNAPLLAWGSAMMRPTRTGSFGESVGNAGAAAIPAIEQQRAQDFVTARDLGSLAIASGEVPTQQEAADEADFWHRQGLAEQMGAAGMRSEAYRAMAGAREAVANTNAAARVTAAGIQANARINVGQLQANKGRFKYEGAVDGDPSTGLYLDTLTGNVNYGPATQGGGSKAMQDAQILVNNGAAPDITTGYAMARAGVNNVHQFEDEVQHEKQLLMSTPQGMQVAQTPGGMEQLEQQARENVISRAQAARLRTPGTTQPPAGGTQPPAAAPAVPAAPSAPAAPAAKNAMPARPSNVPAAAGYSASTNSWWWKDANGAWMSQPGAQ